MIGDHHLELTYASCTARIALSDALRRPLRPVGARMFLKGTGDRGDPPQRMKWRGDHLEARVEGCLREEEDADSSLTPRRGSRLALPEGTSFEIELEDGAILHLN